MKIQYWIGGDGWPRFVGVFDFKHPDWTDDDIDAEEQRRAEYDGNKYVNRSRMNAVKVLREGMLPELLEPYSEEERALILKELEAVRSIPESAMIERKKFQFSNAPFLKNTISYGT